jgi:alkylation response protein AidB-like acyl-CoA dehydrogenase
LEESLIYLQKKHQNGLSFIDHQTLAVSLADMATDIDAARLLTWKAASLIDRGMDSAKASSMCKVFAAEMAERICSRAMQLLGADGYVRECPLEKHLRDVRALSIYEGTNQAQRMVIASML